MTPHPAPALDDDTAFARAYLSRVAEPACVPLWGFVEQVGPVEAAAAIRAGSAPAAVVSATEARCRETDPAADLDAADRHGIRLVAPESADWPHFALGALDRLGRQRVKDWDRGDRSRRESGELVPPLALWVRGGGELACAATRSLAIVGARAATPYGEHVSADLGYGMAVSDVAVVSGGAYGIDATAHRAALAGGGNTILVSAGGLDRPYPTGNAALFEQVAQSGLLVSESPPGAAPHRFRFLSRNRLIAAFGTGTVVVEAALRSGAANTTSHAAAMGRPVMAVPGPVTSPMSAGCHVLLRRGDGTMLVTGAEDVLAVVGVVGSGLGAGPSAAPSAAAGAADLRAQLDALDPVARRVFEGLPARRAARPDEIALRCGVSIVEVLRALPVLDLAGLLAVSDAGYRIAAEGRQARRPTIKEELGG